MVLYPGILAKHGTKTAAGMINLAPKACRNVTGDPIQTNLGTTFAQVNPRQQRYATVAGLCVRGADNEAVLVFVYYYCASHATVTLGKDIG